MTLYFVYELESEGMILYENVLFSQQKYNNQPVNDACFWR